MTTPPSPTNTLSFALASPCTLHATAHPSLQLPFRSVPHSSRSRLQIADSTSCTHTLSTSTTLPPMYSTQSDLSHPSSFHSILTPNLAHNAPTASQSNVALPVPPFHTFQIVASFKLKLAIATQPRPPSSRSWPPPNTIPSPNPPADHQHVNFTHCPRAHSTMRQQLRCHTPQQAHLCETPDSTPPRPPTSPNHPHDVHANILARVAARSIRSIRVDHTLQSQTPIENSKSTSSRQKHGIHQQTQR